MRQNYEFEFFTLSLFLPKKLKTQINHPHQIKRAGLGRKTFSWPSSHKQLSEEFILN